jgi:hypothetical protein
LPPLVCSTSTNSHTAPLYSLWYLLRIPHLVMQATIYCNVCTPKIGECVS